jgi:hypothetical protein
MNPTMTEFLRPMGYRSTPAIGEKIRPPISNALNSFILNHIIFLHDNEWNIELSQRFVFVPYMRGNNSLNIHVGWMDSKKRYKNANQHAPSLRI